MKSIYKIAAGLLLSFTALVLVAGYTSAGSVRCVIRNNGRDSWNRCRIRVRRSKTVVQRNWAGISNVVVAGANTGGNKANGNTGGNVTVTAGSASVSVSITNTVNQTNLTP